jgi:tetratricopeptide (TPR) repeat protein
MIKNIVLVSFLTLIFLVLNILINPDVFGQQSASLQEGINQYKAEKYEEAINSLEKARAEDPKSTVAAFFLGVAYKQTMDYEKAEAPLTDAVTLTPRVKEALIELIDVTMQLGKLDEAKKWVAVAEEENILPAKTAFLKGLIYKEEGKNEEAAMAFAKAKSIDPTIAQASEIQIALSYLTERKLKNAKESFKSAIVQDPQSDLAGFARQYLASVEQAIYAERPLHYTLSVFGQYDDNMVLKPTDESLAANVTNQESYVLNSGFRVNYSPAMEGRGLFNAQYAVTSSVHTKNTHTHDSFSNFISMTPGYNFGKFTLNLYASYTLSHVRGPSYKKYVGSLSVGPMIRIALTQNQLFECFSGYADNKYYQTVLSPDELRTSSGLSTYASWVWLFKPDAFLNLRYQFSSSNAKGRNWDNVLHSFSANVVIPLSEKVKFQMSGQAIRQRFTNVHSTFDIKRRDAIYNFSGGLSWDCLKDISLITQYTRNNNGSNVGIYDYTRNTYSLGIEYRF